MKKNKVFFTPTKPLKNKAVIGKKLGREKNYYCTDHTPAPVARPHLPNARHYFVLIIILLIAILSYVVLHNCYPSVVEVFLGVGLGKVLGVLWF